MNEQELATWKRSAEEYGKRTLDSDRLSRVSVAAESLRRARTELRLALEAARPHHTLEQLGKAAGVSRQAVHGMLKQKEDNR